MKLSRVDNFPTNFGNERDARHGCVDSDHRIWFLVDVAECDPIDFVDIVLVNIQGKILLQQSRLFDQDRINLSDYVAGTYFVKIMTPEGSREICIIKQ